MNRWNQLVDAMSTEEAGTSLALFRILIGLTFAVDTALLYASGVGDLIWAGGPWKTTSTHWLVGLLGGPTLDVSQALMFVAFASSVMIAAGMATRGAAFTAWASLMGLLSMSHGGGAYDILLTIALLFLVVAKSDTTLSVSCRLRSGSWMSSELVPAWPRYVAIYQLALLYTTSAMSKLGAEWLPSGEFRAVYNAVLLPCWARGEWTWLGWFYPVTQAGTAVSWLWEFSWWIVPLALLLGRPSVRRVYVGFGIALHLGLWALINVGPFSPLILSFYVLLYRPSEWRFPGQYSDNAS